MHVLTVNFQLHTDPYKDYPILHPMTNALAKVVKFSHSQCLQIAKTLMVDNQVEQVKINDTEYTQINTKFTIYAKRSVVNKLASKLLTMPMGKVVVVQIAVKPFEKDIRNPTKEVGYNLGA